MENKQIFVTQSAMPPFEEYMETIKPLWESHWLTNMGKYHRELEARLGQYLDVLQLSLMVNGHMALELAIQSFGFPEGAEVITTPYTFISTTHAIVRNRLKPVFCDVKQEDGTMDETKIEELVSERTVGIVPVHVYGHVCNVAAIQRIAEKYNLKVIYDAAHAFGVTYQGKGIGNYGDASIFSFHATKAFHTIEGGAVAFHDRRMYEKLYDLKNFGIRGEELVTEVGANAKMNEFCAAMGLCNLKYADKRREERREKYKIYAEILEGVDGIRILTGNDRDCVPNYAYFPILIDGREYGMDRDELQERLKKKGIFTRKYFYPLTADQACFKNKYRKDKLDTARKMSKQVLVLPFYADMGNGLVEEIAQTIRERIF